MSHTHVILRYMYPKLIGTDKDVWDGVDDDSKIKKYPNSAGELSEKLKWDKCQTL
jgi:hypothetical protein